MSEPKPLWQVKVACTDLEGDRVVSTQYVHVSDERVAEVAAIQRVRDAGVRSIDAVLTITRGRFLTDHEFDALSCTCGAAFEPCPLHNKGAVKR
jgi:pyrimidine deaminase RibD-like protein